ncbi:metallophosphoesterase [Larkinella knui]|uniref:Serine/threonine protein phosphatase n=1 Tax=Larkinella knui TaxID=2025310 RepID=A0A3P1CF16_9BACT|nr:metallophosphoesterase [Larkinella knui]RRB11474.1 serine/threonine protein phosphatase [Larkinella knui]
MKILTISDLHGRNSWQQVDVTQYDKVIFLGDYTDSYELSDRIILENLQQIIGLKQQYPDKVVLLLGNHDAQYLHFPHYRCSGFRSSMQPALSALFTEQKSLFQIAHQQNSYVFTHAGVSNRWLAHLPKGDLSSKLEPNLQTLDQLATVLNAMHEDRMLRTSLFDISYLRGGYEEAGGPVWADKLETSTDYIAGLHQIVGHTPVPEFVTIGDQTGSITYTDVLQTQEAFYTLEIVSI